MPPTIHDLRTRHCFICHDTEHFDRRSDDPDGWVHPCNCTLIAHQSCLMEMIDALPATTLAQCPQCNHTYTIQQTPSLRLATFRLGNAIYRTSGLVFVTVGATAFVIYSLDRLVTLLRLYGTFTLKSIFGDELFSILLTDDVTNWSWSNRIFIPLISLRSLLSMTPFNTRHLLSWILVFPSEPPRIIREQLVQNALRIDTSDSLARVFATPFDTFRPRWPPTRIQFGMCIYIFRLAHDFLALRTVRLSSLLPGNSGLLMDVWTIFTALRRFRFRRVQAEVNNDPPFVVEVNLEADIHIPAPQADDAAPGDVEVPPAQVPNAQEEPPADVDVAIEFNAAQGILEVIAIPFIARGMGEIVRKVSVHWRPVQHVLGIRPVIASQIGIHLSSNMLTDINYWKRFTVWLWSETLDPVWIRNTLGLGIFYLAKDCVQSVYIYLKRQEIASRKIKSRNFAGLDPRELDLIHPIT